MAREQLMADVYSYVPSTGVIVPDTATIQADVQNEYRALFGDDMVRDAPNTPQGLLINAETQARIAVVDNNAALANQINPNFAGGIFLDAILSLMGSQRNTSTESLVQCTLNGVIGTVIPEGSQAMDANGNLWQLLTTTTLPLSGTIDAPFAAVEPGPITVAASSITIIVSNVLGWESVTNAAIQTYLGTLTQSDVQARQFRNNTLFLQGNSLAGSIIAGLYATTGVQSLSFLENITSGSLTIPPSGPGGVTLTANSIYVCVNGGTDSAIASTLTATKSGGCGYSNGASATNVSVSYVVPISGQTIMVLFDRPDSIVISIEITVVINTPIQNPETTIQNAILKYAAGQVNGLAGFVVGQNVSPFEIAASVGIQYPGVYVQDLQIKNVTSSGSFVRTELPIYKYQIPTIVIGNIAVTVA